MPCQLIQIKSQTNKIKNTSKSKYASRQTRERRAALYQLCAVSANTNTITNKYNNKEVQICIMSERRKTFGTVFNNAMPADTNTMTNKYIYNHKKNSVQL